MPSKAALQISIEGDASDAVRSFDDVTSAARGMGDTVERASKQADDSASRLDSTADAADNVASRSSQAAGGLGDLGGALAGMGGPLGAVGAGMETLAPTIMGVTGAADLLNLATSSNIVVSTKAAIASARLRASTIASTVSTKAAAAAQRVLNAVMRANPLGLVITAVLLLVSGFILLYKRSETFRTIVKAAMGAARAAVGALVGAVSGLVGWFRDKLGPAISRISDVARSVGGAAVSAFKKITSTVGDIVSKVGDLIGKIRDTLGPAVSATKTVVVNAFDAMLTPVKTLVDWVKDLIDWISKIDMPNINVPGFRTVSGGVTTVGSSGGAGDVIQIQLPLLAALDDSAIAQLIAALTEFYRRRGLRIELGPA